MRLQEKNWCAMPCSLKRRQAKAMIDVASNLEGMVIMPDELDSDIWKLNCKNGVVDLKTGELLPHKREYYMSKICPVEYKPSSKAPDGWIF